jgi:hypothetical protein
MLRKLFSIALLCVLYTASPAQEFNCQVTVMHDKISGTGVDPQVYTGLQKALTELINGHKWTTDEFSASERIELKILLNLTGNNVNGDKDAYGATMSIQASRPVYNSGYTSPLINYVDKDVVFHFTTFSPLNFDDNQVSGTDPMTSNLTAIVGYYCYMVLGLDYDSFAPQGGSAYFKKAQNVVNNAPDGKGITGWKPGENQRNRYWLVDQFLNSRFEDARRFWYTMHREGLDSMSQKPSESRTRILTNIRKLYQVNRENPSSILIQFMFNAKSDELVHLLAQAPKQERGQYITLLDALDVPNAPKYNALR